MTRIMDSMQCHRFCTAVSWSSDDSVLNKTNLRTEQNEYAVLIVHCTAKFAINSIIFCNQGTSAPVS